MIIKFDNYTFDYHIYSLAKSKAVLDDLISKGIDCIYYNDRIAQLYPIDTFFELTEREQKLLDECESYDVFEIDSSGNAYKCFDNKSLDNAIFITNQCNSNCIMCPTPELLRKTKSFYTADILIEIAKHFPSDCAHITITGGEPFLLGKEIFNLFLYLKETFRETQFLLLTNGRVFSNNEYSYLLYKNAPEQLCIGIPIHGHTPKLHDKITQSTGSFYQTFNGIKNLLNLNIKIEIRIVISNLNKDFLKEIAELISNNFSQIMCVKFIGLEMTGAAAKNEKEVWLGYPEAFQKSKEAISILINSGIDVGIYNFPLCAVEKEYWYICEKSISPHKVRFADICRTCSVADACGGLFSGTIRLAKKELYPVNI